MEQQRNAMIFDIAGKREATDKEQIIIRLAKHFYHCKDDFSEELSKIVNNTTGCYDTVDVQLAEFYILKKTLIMSSMENLKRNITVELNAIASCDSVFDADKLNKLAEDLYRVIDEFDIF